VWRKMIIVIHEDDNSEEAANGRHCLNLGCVIVLVLCRYRIVGP
jgi:hypothetical protein